MDKDDKQEILEAINEFSSQVEERFGSLESGVKQEIKKTELKLLDHMDRRFAEFEGSLLASLRQEDNKVNLILEILEHYKVAPKEEIDRVRRIKLFPTLPELS